MITVVFQPHRGTLRRLSDYSCRADTGRRAEQQMLQKTEPANGENGRQQAAEEAARQVSLTYVSDREPGISRRRAGAGFSFVGPNGKPIATKRRCSASTRSSFHRPGRTSGSAPTRMDISRRPGATSGDASSTDITRAGWNAAMKPNIRASPPLPARCRRCVLLSRRTSESGRCHGNASSRRSYGCSTTR